MYNLNLLKTFQKNILEIVSDKKTSITISDFLSNMYFSLLNIEYIDLPKIIKMINNCLLMRNNSQLYDVKYLNFDFWRLDVLIKDASLSANKMFCMDLILFQITSFIESQKNDIDITWENIDIVSYLKSASF
jgi:hypothetical protein